MTFTTLQPAIVLVLWTLFMLVWMLATRLPAMRKANIKLTKLVGTTARDADKALPAQAQWKAHNYNHLLEQPVLFYAVCLILHVLGGASPVSLVLAWGYVALRVAHSLVQATSNRVGPRFALFFCSSLLLTGLAVEATVRAF